MLPILARFELLGRPFVVGSYSTFMVLAWVAALAVGTWFASRRGMPRRRVLAAYAVALAAGIVGARAFDLVTAGGFYAEDPARVWGLTFQGFSLYGGFAMAAVTAIALARAWSLPVWRLADSAVPALATGIVLMRVGCFLRGCCFGVETTLPWGVTFPAGSPAWSQQVLEGGTGILGLMGLMRPVHPTQLYEAGAAIVLCAGALLLMRAKSPDGVGFLIFALAFTVFRTGNASLRARLAIISVPDWFYVVFYGVVITVLLGLLTSRLLPRAAPVHDPATTVRATG